MCCALAVNAKLLFMLFNFKKSVCIACGLVHLLLIGVSQLNTLVSLYNHWVLYETY